MNFSRLKLTEGISSSNNLATNAEAKTSEMASGIGKQKQMNPAAKEQQIKQRAARTGPTTMNNTVDVAPVATTTESYLDTLHKVQLEKAHRHHTHNWRKELAEAVNPDDDPQHPYVEIMPHFKYKEKEAKKNAGKAAMTDRQNGEAPLKTGVNEEAKYNSKQKAAARKLNHIQDKTKAEAKKARNKFKKAKDYHSKGEESKALQANKAGEKHANKARSLRSKEVSLSPMGSTTYSHRKDPSKSNKKYKHDVKTKEGRRAIASRTVHEDSFEIFSDFLDEESLKDKKDSGKAVPMSRGVRNADNTATPKENAARRVVNANPSMRGDAGKAAVDRMMKEQSMADAKKRRQNLTIETGMRRRQANPEMPKPNLDNAKSNHGA